MIAEITEKVQYLFQAVEKRQKKYPLLLESEILDSYQKRKILNEIFGIKRIETPEKYQIVAKNYIPMDILEVRNSEKQLIGVLFQKKNSHFVLSSYSKDSKQIVEYHLVKNGKIEILTLEIDQNHLQIHNIFYFSNQNEEILNLEEVISKIEDEIEMEIEEDQTKIYQIKRK